jgi:16S rRNA (guanine527-N7)-methyltransferase
LSSASRAPGASATPAASTGRAGKADAVPDAGSAGSAADAADLARALQSDAAAMGWSLPDHAADRLASYRGLLAKWNDTYNLTALRDPAQMRTQHLADCLAVVAPLRRHAAARPLRVLDVGSGGGLPGVVLAIVEPAWDVTCVDTVGKKAAFVRQVAAELGLPNLHAEHARVEALRAGRPFDLITSRAFASLPDFVRLTRPLLAPAGAWMAMKGKRPDDEIAALPPGVQVQAVEPLQVPGLEAERCLLWLVPTAAP